MSLEFRTLQPAEFYLQHISTGVRPDGRSLAERRPLSVSAGNITTADGSAVVKLGATTVVCGVRAELATPRTEEPALGYLVPNISLPPMCSTLFKPGPPSVAAQSTSQFLATVLATSGCVRQEDLCISPGKMVWVLYIDLVCLDHSGNIMDASVSALTSALETVTLPSVTMDTDTGEVVVSDKKRTKLKLDSSPVSTTFAVFNSTTTSSPYLLSDPTSEEEQLSSSLVTVVTTGGDVCHLHQPGGDQLSPQLLQQAVQLATNREKLVAGKTN
jgi:exosome complex component RRP43